MPQPQAQPQAQRYRNRSRTLQSRNKRPTAAPILTAKLHSRASLTPRPPHPHTSAAQHPCKAVALAFHSAIITRKQSIGWGGASAPVSAPQAASCWRCNEDAPCNDASKKCACDGIVTGAKQSRQKTFAETSFTYATFFSRDISSRDLPHVTFT